MCALQLEAEPSQNRSKKTKKVTEGGKIVCNCLKIMIWIQKNSSLLMHLLIDIQKPLKQQTPRHLIDISACLYNHSIFMLPVRVLGLMLLPLRRKKACFQACSFSFYHICSLPLRYCLLTLRKESKQKKELRKTITRILLNYKKQQKNGQRPSLVKLQIKDVVRYIRKIAIPIA